MNQDVWLAEKEQPTQTDFKLKKDSEVILCQLMLPYHSNFGGKIFGGFILSLMDQVAYACASKHSGSYCVTASINTVNFLNPIEVGDLVTLKASINYVGKSSMVVGIRIESENIQTGENKHCNSSYFTMVAVEKIEGKYMCQVLFWKTKKTLGDSKKASKDWMKKTEKHLF